VAGQAAPAVAEDPASLLEYLVDRMLTGYEQDDDVTVLVLHVPVRDGTAKALVTESLGVQATGGRGGGAPPPGQQGADWHDGGFHDRGETG
jgi:hypothetical protein